MNEWMNELVIPVPLGSPGLLLRGEGGVTSGEMEEGLGQLCFIACQPYVGQSLHLHQSET